MSEPLDGPSRARRLQMRLVTTLAAWFVAFLIVLVLLSLFGRKLESLPSALNALVFTGVLVPIMGNLVMPLLGAAVARRMAGPPQINPHGSSSGAAPETSSTAEQRASDDACNGHEALAGADIADS